MHNRRFCNKFWAPLSTATVPRYCVDCWNTPWFAWFASRSSIWTNIICLTWLSLISLAISECVPLVILKILFRINHAASGSIVMLQLEGKTWRPLCRHCTQNVSCSDQLKLLAVWSFCVWLTYSHDHYKMQLFWLKMVSIFRSPTCSQNFHFFMFQPQSTLKSLQGENVIVAIWAGS